MLADRSSQPINRVGEYDEFSVKTPKASTAWSPVHNERKSEYSPLL